MICIQNVSLQKPLERATITDLVKKLHFRPLYQGWVKFTQRNLSTVSELSDMKQNVVDY